MYIREQFLLLFDLHYYLLFMYYYREKRCDKNTNNEKNIQTMDDKVRILR